MSKDIEIITSVLNNKKRLKKKEQIYKQRGIINNLLDNEMNKILKNDYLKILERYKYMKLLKEKEHGVIGLPINILLNNDKNIYLKIGFYSDIYKYNIKDKNNVHFQEYIITKLLYNFVKSDITPHLIEPLNLYNCKKEQLLNYIKNFKKPLDYSKDSHTLFASSKSKSIFNNDSEYITIYNKLKDKIELDNQKTQMIRYDLKIFKWIRSDYLSLMELEWLNGDTLYNYLCKLLDYKFILKSKNIEEKLLIIYFEIIYTLICVNRKYSKFQHNDLHFKNIIIKSPKQKKGYNQYILDDKSYYINLNKDIEVKIFDFDKSNIDNIENTRIKTKFKYSLYNHLDNNYDSFHILSGLYRLIFQKYFNLLNDIISESGGKILKETFLSLERKIRIESNNDSYNNIINLNKKIDIVIFKIMYLIKDIERKYTEDDLKQLILFTNGNIKNIIDIKDKLKMINKYRDIIRLFSNHINYLPFIYIYLNDKYATIMMNDYEEHENNTNYTILYYIQNKVEDILNIKQFITYNSEEYINDILNYLDYTLTNYKEKLKKEFIEIYKVVYNDILNIKINNITNISNKKMYIDSKENLKIFDIFLKKKDNINNIYNINNELINIL